ncbi:GMC oxidoreductase [Streptomyces sp. Ag109_G2-15]|uniref:GMC oxidoreductase n=1 Tax=Streptomyces sp. Ag109_G2-15 TaxID=1938850 RepID=UPI000BD86EC2|nr:GMC oxidoreductase [Streptomyces sp. Ag109_G2-15]SOD84784.1 GMC oxidoreductase [Streptomyces sp. Ag109_G2-15]
MPRNIRVFDHKRPTLSVVVPCSNEAEVLAQTHARPTRVLASLAAFDCELIHVDDGSADDTCDRVRPGDRELVSVHGMGSCPMALPERGGVCDEAGRPHGFTNLRLCDASVLPGTPGISPQGTIRSFAREIVGRHPESA